MFFCTVKGLQNGVNIRWGLFMPSGSAMKAVAKLVDEGKVVRCCLLCFWLQCSLLHFIVSVDLFLLCRHCAVLGFCVAG